MCICHYSHAYSNYKVMPWCADLLDSSNASGMRIRIWIRIGIAIKVTTKIRLGLGAMMGLVDFSHRHNFQCLNAHNVMHVPSAPPWNTARPLYGVKALLSGAEAYL